LTTVAVQGKLNYTEILGKGKGKGKEGRVMFFYTFTYTSTYEIKE